MNYLKIEYVSIEQLVPYANNAKLHPAEQIEQIKRSIQDNGMNDPIGIWHDQVVEGHGRLIACKELGMTEVPVIRLDHMTDEQRRQYMLIHNQTTMNSGWDLPVLDMELGDLPDFDAEFYGFEINTDFDESDLDAGENGDEKTVVRVVFENYKDYQKHEYDIKAFVESIGASMTVGK